MTAAVHYGCEGRVAVLRVDNPPVNALSQSVRQGIADGLARAASDDAVDAVVLACEGRTFIAGVMLWCRQQRSERGRRNGKKAAAAAQRA